MTTPSFSLDRLKLAAENYRLWRDQMLTNPHQPARHLKELDILRAQVADLVLEILPEISQAMSEAREDGGGRMSDAKDYVSRKELARILGVSTDTVDAARKKGKIVMLAIGGGRYHLPSVVDALKASRTMRMRRIKFRLK